MVLFSGKINSGKVELKIDGKVLKREKKVTFVGIFDFRLSWKGRVQYVVEKWNKKINLMKVLTGCRWGANKETMLILSRGLIRLCLEYGSGVYDSTCKT